MFSSQQEQAITQVKDWLKQKRGRAPVFRLFGFAGTGKTTIAKALAGGMSSVRFMAFTGKAAMVMRSKGCDGAATIHSSIYKRTGIDGREVFTLDTNSPVRKAKLIVVDECSMVGEELAKDLLSFGVPVLALGDPAQLPPVDGAGYFTDAKPDFLLTEVHRQARDNPIIKLSMDIREGRRLAMGDYGSSRVISKTDISSDVVMQADQILVGLNRTRAKYNQRLRQLRGFSGDAPMVGERLICLRNDREKGVMNGSIWRAERVELDGRIVQMGLSSMDEPGVVSDVTVPIEFFTGQESTLDFSAKRGHQQFTFGYAVTCHKAQGSQWPNIVIFNESFAFKDDWSRWLYTAVTRASDRLTLVQ